MHILKVIIIVVVFLLGLFCTIVCYILNRDKYWRRIWIEYGKPPVKSINEIKAYIIAALKIKNRI